MVAVGHAGLVAELFADVEGALVVAGGFVVVPAVLGQDAEIVVAAGHAGLVAEPLFDVEGALVVAGGFAIVPAGVGKNAELAGPRGLARRIRRQPGEGVIDQRGFLVPGAPGVQLAAGPLGDLGGVFGVSGMQQVVTGLQPVMHIGCLVRRPHPDQPPPVRGRLPVRPGQPQAGLAGGPLGQLSGSPTVHEKPRLLTFVVDGKEACCLAGGDLLLQAGSRPERRNWCAVQLGDVRRQLSLDMAGDGRQVEGLVHGDPGGGQDAGDLLVSGRPAGDVLGVRVGLPGLEQHRVAVDRFPVHRDTEQQVRRAGNLGQAGQQVIEQDIIGSQGNGLGQGSSQLGAGGQPLAAIGPAQVAGDRRVEPGGHVRVAGLAAGQQGIEVFQRPRMAARKPPHLLQLALVEPVQGRQRPGQLHRLRPRQCPQLPERQGPLRAAGQREPVPGGDQQSAPPRVTHPRGQQPGQHLITDRVPRIAVRVEVVFEVVQQQQDRHVVQDMAAEDGEPVRPAQVRPGRDVEGPDRRGGVLAADQQLAADGGDNRAEQAFQGQRAGQADQDPAGLRVPDPGDDLGGQRGLAGPADPVDDDARQQGPGQVGGPAPLLGPPPDEIPVLPPGQPRDPRPGRLPRRRRGVVRIEHRHRSGGGQDGHGCPFPQAGQLVVSLAGGGLQFSLDLAACLRQSADHVRVAGLGEGAVDPGQQPCGIGVGDGGFGGDYCGGAAVA